MVTQDSSFCWKGLKDEHTCHHILIMKQILTRFMVAKLLAFVLLMIKILALSSNLFTCCSWTTMIDFLPTMLHGTMYKSVL